VARTLRLIQHKWLVLAYNFNVVILVLINRELSIRAFLLTHFTIVLFLLLPCIIILFLHLLSTNHKCTQPCYFPLLLKPVAQKEKMGWNPSMRSSRLCVGPIAVPVEL
jgi:Trk-type K+ transport system membrane component